MKNKKAKGIPCSNMKEFDAIMDGSTEQRDWKKDYSIERDNKSYTVESEGRHTPGPWTQEKGCPWNYEIDGQHFMCVAFPREVPEMERNANMRLIAAAPELLEALKLMIREFGYDNVHSGMVNAEHEALRRAMSVIAKAEGSSNDSRGGK